MKKISLFISSMFFFLFIFLSFSACTEKERTYTTDMLDIEKEIPFIFRSGGKYSLKTAEITNLITKEVAIKTVDDILFSEDKEWYCLYSFSTSIHKESKFFYIDDIWYLFKNNLMYKIMSNMTLKLHFPRWNSISGIYDVVIYLNWTKTYG